MPRTFHSLFISLSAAPAESPTIRIEENCEHRRQPQRKRNSILNREIPFFVSIWIFISSRKYYVSTSHYDTTPSSAFLPFLRQTQSPNANAVSHNANTKMTRLFLDTWHIRFSCRPPSSHIGRHGNEIGGVDRKTAQANGFGECEWFMSRRKKDGLSIWVAVCVVYDVGARNGTLLTKLNSVFSINRFTAPNTIEWAAVRVSGNCIDRSPLRFYPLVLDKMLRRQFTSSPRGK